MDDIDYEVDDRMEVNRSLDIDGEAEVFIRLTSGKKISKGQISKVFCPKTILFKKVSMIAIKTVIDDALAQKNMRRSRDPFGNAAEMYVRDDNKQEGILSDNYQNISLQNVS